MCVCVSMRACACVHVCMRACVYACKCMYVHVLCELPAPIHTEQQHFEARIDQLTSDKTELLTQVQYCKEELKATNECEKCCMKHVLVYYMKSTNLKLYIYIYTCFNCQY